MAGAQLDSPSQATHTHTHTSAYTNSGILNKAPPPWASPHSLVDKTVHPMPVVTQGLLSKNVNSSSLLAYVHMGSSLGFHTWTSSHCNPCRMHEEEVCAPYVWFLLYLPQPGVHVCPFILFTAAEEACYGLNFMIRKEWGDRKAKISATFYKEFMTEDLS